MDNVLKTYKRSCPGCNGMLFTPVKGTYDIYTCASCGSMVQFVVPDLSANEITPRTLFERGYIELRNKQFTEARKSFDRAIDRAPDFSQAYFARCLATNHCMDRDDLYGCEMIERLISAINIDGKYSNGVTKQGVIDVFTRACGSDWDTALNLASEVDLKVYNEVLVRVVDKTIPSYIQHKYKFAVQKQESGTYDNLCIAYDRFCELGDFLDSKTRSKMCFDAICEERYSRDVARYGNKLSIDELKDLEQEFLILGDYKNSKRYAKECQKRYSLIGARAIGSNIGKAVIVVSYVYLAIASYAHLPDYITALLLFCVAISSVAALVSKHFIRFSIINACAGTAVGVFFGESINPRPLLAFNAAQAGGGGLEGFLERTIGAPFYWLFLMAIIILPVILVSIVSAAIKKATLGQD